MTVYNDLERAIAIAEAARGNYLLFATDTEEEKARKVFTDMAEDMRRHVMILESRKQYLEQQNPLNAAGRGGSGDQQQKGQKQSGQNGQNGQGVQQAQGAQPGKDGAQQQQQH